MLMSSGQESRESPGGTAMITEAGVSRACYTPQPVAKELEEQDRRDPLANSDCSEEEDSLLSGSGDRRREQSTPRRNGQVRSVPPGGATERESAKRPPAARTRKTAD